MMSGDDDIAASLPRPPLPAPARREAAIDAALRRFDGKAPAQAADGRRAPRWLAPGRPYAGALAGAFLVALIGVPFVWTSFDRYAPEEGARVGTRVEAPASPAAMADSASASAAADAASSAPPTASKPGAPAEQAPAGGAAPDTGADAAPGPAPAASEAPAPLPTDAAADVAPSESREIVVTGTRIRRPNLESAVPITSIGAEKLYATGDRARRGDWNACTIDDPDRDLNACRRDIATVARGASGKASAPLADGLSKAWEGDLEAAIAAFDHAAETAPRSAAAYLNRGLARRDLGDLDGALADLNRAVANAPQAARGYYQRSLLLRQRGETKRARADEERAVELDPSFAEPVKAQRKRAK